MCLILFDEGHIPATDEDLTYGNVVIEKPKVLLIAPTGVAAMQVDGTMVHIVSGIHVGTKLPPLHEKMKYR